MLKIVDIDGGIQYLRYFVDWQNKNKLDGKQGVRAINIIAAKNVVVF